MKEIHGELIEWAGLLMALSAVYLAFGFEPALGLAGIVVSIEGYGQQKKANGDWE